VGEVIRRRTALKYASDGTIAGTVARRYQFSATVDDKVNNDLFIRGLKIDDDDPVVQDCIKAWHQSQNTNVTNGAVLYCNLDSASPSWATPAKCVAKVGNHSFFIA
jgi:spore germination cell wall hydrolase CwlJ-like protein